MNALGYLASVVEGRRQGAAAGLVLCLLTPFTWIYRAGLKLFLLPYALGLRKRRHLPRRVVSVGNLTFGGTGKTPAVQAVCGRLLDMGVRPAVLTRGHGGRVRGVKVVTEPGAAWEIGDEAAMLSAALAGVPIGVGRRREQAGRAILKQHDPDLFVLDDGLQYWQLERDCDIIVVAADRPLGSGRIMPAGDLREPATGIRRANAVLVVGDEASGRARGAVEKLAPCTPVFAARRVAVGLRSITTGARLATSWLQGRRVCVLSGIGNPASFENMLGSTGALVAEVRSFPDHHRYRSRDLADVDSAAKAARCEAIVTTEKDAVRLPPLFGDVQVLALEIALEIDDMDRLMTIVWPDSIAG